MCVFKGEISSLSPMQAHSDECMCFIKDRHLLRENVYISVQYLHPYLDALLHIHLALRATLLNVVQ